MVRWDHPGGKKIKGIVIAGAKSGSGKTTLTLGMLAALVKRGLKVASFKVGPDFIDPGHHKRITSRISRNLDGWMLPRTYNWEIFHRYAAGADVVVVEGVMGLYDGYDGRSEAGSTAQMAKWLGLPVILVVDAKSMARSAAALVQGFEGFDPDLSFAGVLFNNVASDRHHAYLTEALEGHVRMPLLGSILRRSEITIPERHLGLVTTEDHPLTEDTTAALAELVESGIDLDNLLEKIVDLHLPPPHIPDGAQPPGDPVRIGVAMDNAFCFYYQDNLDLLASFGAEITPFSPITDPHLPENVDGLYFGGGYPELFARQLSANDSLHREIRQAVDGGLPVYGECGGFMFLGESIRDLKGHRYPMVGCFPLQFLMQPRLKSLGYREITFTTDTILGRAGQTLRGHEFHYSEMTGKPVSAKDVYRVTTRTGLERRVPGFQKANCLGSYVHMHFGSNPSAAPHWVAACREYRLERKKPHETP